MFAGEEVVTEGRGVGEALEGGVHEAGVAEVGEAGAAGELLLLGRVEGGTVGGGVER